MAAKFPQYRPRRMRQSESYRRLIRETHLSAENLIMPYFVQSGSKVCDPINAMPGQFRYSPDTLLPEIESLVQSGVNAILLFGIPENKDLKASEAWSSTGIVQEAVRQIRKEFRDLLVITDVCLCAFMSHGHCGVISETGEIVNDESVRLLADVAQSHAEAGSSLIAPSDMMDGRIAVIRERLDQAGFEQIPIMSYAAKYASAFYGPFRDAADLAPDFGDRKSYQMDPANVQEALREIASDIEEGADIVMVKPALAYLDVIREASNQFSFPLCAYSVSGEYSMIKAAAQKGWIDEKKIVLEQMTSILRAGAQSIITYHAKAIGSWLQQPKISQTALNK